MKRNFLGILFAMLMGVVCANAQTTVTIDVDVAANVSATDGVYGTPISLHDGINSVELSNNPLSIQAASGAEISSVFCDGLPVSKNGAGMYNIGVVEGMSVKIVTEGSGASKKIQTYFSINNPNSAQVTSGGETFDITNNYYDLAAGEYAVVAPKEGYVIESCSEYSVEDFTQNDDGTFSFLPAEYGMIYLTTKLQGIDFTVDVNVRSNVIVNAYNEANEDLGVVGFTNWQKPFTATAPKATQSLVFSAPAGGEIKSIKRIQADGTESNVNFSPYAGWRSMLADGDNFVVEAVGPDATLTFWGYNANRQDLDLSNFIVKVGGEKLDLSGVQAQGVAHVGDILTVEAGKGFALNNYAISSSFVSTIETTGAVQSGMVTGAGDVFLYAAVDNSMVINVDNAAAVKVVGANGYGEVLTLQNGENKFESVVNPLKITAADKYEILSITLDGEAVASQSGSYTVELLSGSTLAITTREIPSAFPVTIMTMGGDIENIVIKKDGEVVDYMADGLEAMVGSDITIAPALGYMLESVSDMNGNSVEFNEDTDVWTVAFTKTASMISVMFKAAPEGKAFVGFSRDSSDVMALVYDKKGDRKDDPASLKDGRTVELEIGDQVELKLWGNNRDLEEIIINGTAIEFAAGTTVLDKITITERTVIVVTTKEHEKLVDIKGDQSIETIIGTGAVIGNIYINEIGQDEAFLRPGEKFYVIPVPAKGYKFAGFKYISGNLPVPEPVDGKYEFTVPEDRELVFFQGNFVLDEENPVYLVEGNTIYEEGTTNLMGLTRIADGTQQGAMFVYAHAGETVELLFFLNIDQFPEDKYYCESFCLYNNPSVLIPQKYVVNPDDVRDNNIISIGAIVKSRDESGVSEVPTDGALVYNAAAATVTSATAVKVFTISGQLVKELPAGETSLDALSNGVYILSNGVETLKIVR